MKGYFPSVQRDVDALAAAQAKLKKTLARVQRNCRHFDLIEADYQTRYGTTFPPVRCCCNCGMTEDGWGPGYVVLTGRAVMTDRDEVYRRRLGVMILDEHKGPLLRKEVTVAQLVDREFGTATAGVPAASAQTFPHEPPMKDSP